MAATPSTPRTWSPQLRVFSDADDAAQAMRDIGADEQGVRIMTPKSVYRHVFLAGVPIPASQILKEEMLSAGGEAVRTKGAVSSQVPATDVLMMGTEAHFARVIKKLRMQPFGLKALAEELTTLLSAVSVGASRRILRAGARRLELGSRTLVMGILNLTPDSFSGDGLAHPSSATALEYALKRAEGMLADGADMIDVGGESSRPGATPVSAEEEAERVIPVIRALSERLDVLISVDTYKSSVAREAIAAGAEMVNDISGLRLDPEMTKVVAGSDAALVVMHMSGTPATMQSAPVYTDVVVEVISSLRESMAVAVDAGIPEERLVVDVGIGFGKTGEHNLELLRRLPELRSLGLPVLVGTSRKAFIGNVLGGLPVEDRLEGTAATVALSVTGGADIVRVHDVRAMARVVRMTDAVIRRRTDAQ